MKKIKFKEIEIGDMVGSTNPKVTDKLLCICKGFELMRVVVLKDNESENSSELISPAHYLYHREVILLSQHNNIDKYHMIAKLIF